MRQLIDKWQTFRANRRAWNHLGDDADRIVQRHWRAVVAQYGRLEAIRMQWRNTFPEMPAADEEAYERLQARLAEVAGRMPAWQRY
jgi:hypothetical protein